MKIRNLLFFAFLLISGIQTLNAQTWIKKQEGIANSAIRQMCFLNSTTGYATCGDAGSGYIFKTTNGGNKWTKIPSGNSNTNYDVQFINVSTGFICSLGGNITKTTNEGLNWTKVAQHPSNAHLFTLGFLDANTGYAGGAGYLTRTTNGGDNWNITTFTGSTINSNAVLSTSKAILCGSQTGSDGGIWTSTDAGASWVYTQLTTNDILSDIYFIDANTGYVCGSGSRVFRSTNGGANWTQVTIGSQGNISCVYFKNETTGFITTSSGEVLGTTDSGENWTSCIFIPGISQTEYDIWFFDADNGIMCGAGGLVYKTSDAGVTWKSVGTNNQLNAINMLDNSTGYVAGINSIIQKTTDEGNSWSFVTSVPASIYFSSMCFINSSTGYIGTSTGSIIKTTNEGANWVTLTPGVAFAILSIDFIDSNTGYFSTSAGGVGITTNGGTNWSVVTTGASTNMTSLYFIDANTGFVTSTAGSVRKTTNGGTNWISIPTGGTQQLNSVYFFDENTGYVAGNTGAIFYTTNGGMNWTQQSTGVTATINSIKFGDPERGVAIGNSGTILVTTNSGANWVNQTSLSGTTQHLRSVALTPNGGILVCGSFGTILSSIDQPLPVELASFTSSVSGQNVTLSWSTVMEENNKGFEIERRSSGEGWKKTGYAEGNGTSNQINNYSFTERGMASGNYNYRLKQIDYNGNYKYYDLSNEVIIGIPSKYSLSQNYPNPFNPVSVINFELPTSNYVSLNIYDINGRKVAGLVNEVKEAGYYSVQFDAKNLSSGMYFYKLTSGNFSAVKKMVVVK